MKDKHIAIRIEQCLFLANASRCPRRRLAAVIVDPKRNVVLADGYNGGPRGSPHEFCGDFFCEREGFLRDKVEIVIGEQPKSIHESRTLSVKYGSRGRVQWFEIFNENEQDARQRAEAWIDKVVEKYPPIESGTRVEIGCMHAEMNVLMNAAAGGVSTEGSWLIVTGEPCLMCAKLIHHAGIVKVLCVKGGFKGGDAGPKYLRENGVEVTYVEGPKDPRECCSDA